MRISKLFKKAALTAVITSISFGSAIVTSVPKAEAATAKSIKLISTGKKYLGVPYRFGAPSGSSYAFDCSSFTQFVYKKLGLSIPRTSTAQARVGKKVTPGYISTGDLIFYNTNGKGISHVGIYAGNGKMLHTSSSRGVTVSSMKTSYWKTKYVTARRVIR
ncbi:NlpC/P60 family protein [Cohnella pontilimi]|uniref:NlpC/P60 family protein n=1 Tax=Cohnella pontilimi TaxID=2564100 RepID=A0A4U0FDP3_9BACL|nr:C40 family peptidase [Cohnella pontilimi]TJY42910.1 NlpC/P60 family protein [Cohnella pontilimi]